MRFLLGCLGALFVVFGGCVFVTGILALPSASDVGFLVLAASVGAAILVAGGWAIFKAVTMHRLPPNAGPPRH